MRLVLRRLADETVPAAGQRRSDPAMPGAMGSLPGATLQRERRFDNGAAAGAAA
jgi:hypothetical protein